MGGALRCSSSRRPHCADHKAQTSNCQPRQVKVLAQLTGPSIIPKKLERLKSADEEYLSTKQRGVVQAGAILLNHAGHR